MALFSRLRTQLELFPLDEVDLSNESISLLYLLNLVQGKLGRDTHHDRADIHTQADSKADR